MAGKKTVFIAFAMEDERIRDLFVGQRLNNATPFEWTDMSVDEPYPQAIWKERVRTRVRRSDGVIALISPSTPGAEGQLWEIQCATEEGKPLLGIYIKGATSKPAALGTAPCATWDWDNVTDFIDGL